ncbi:hypothetical protein PGTUg99_007476 [Puccinia graminis f. sp. tritici]|uniref:Uncharacterized protein n=1 Tax=Puccinia graminis f. sp. tritici TaxID=56615 RepID=A0A5B0LUG8_PUCGR|nr:hypothetical protein PGTUg99_007476 [Puccinia graminis f. sp. tritici]
MDKNYKKLPPPNRPPNPLASLIRSAFWFSDISLEWTPIIASWSHTTACFRSLSFSALVFEFEMLTVAVLCRSSKEAFRDDFYSPPT